MIFAIKALALIGTLATIAFVYEAHARPSMLTNRCVAALAAGIIVAGIPMLAGALFCILFQKWAAVYFLFGLITAFSAGALSGYHMNRWRRKDPFDGAMTLGLAFSFLSGWPLAMMLLP